MTEPIVFIRSLNDITAPGTYAPQNRDGIPFPDSFIQVGIELGEESWDEYCLYISQLTSDLKSGASYTGSPG